MPLMNRIPSISDADASASLMGSNLTNPNSPLGGGKPSIFSPTNAGDRLRDLFRRLEDALVGALAGADTTPQELAQLRRGLHGAAGPDAAAVDELIVACLGGKSASASVGPQSKSRTASVFPSDDDPGSPSMPNDADLPPPLFTCFHEPGAAPPASPAARNAATSLALAIADAVRAAELGAAMVKPRESVVRFNFPTDSHSTMATPDGTYNGTYNGTLNAMPNSAAPSRRNSIPSFFIMPSSRRASRMPAGSRRESKLSASLASTHQSFLGAPLRAHRTDSVVSNIRTNPFSTGTAEVSEVEFDGTSSVNQYVLLHSIGQGRQGEVMLAMDTDANEMRAIKVMPRPAQAQSATGLRSRLPMNHKAVQMQHEIAIMKKCRHRNIVALYEVIDDPAANSLYLVMQYVEHGSLVEMNPDGTTDRCIAPDVLVGMARQLCAGLHYLHNHGVIHRDIKPDNILLGNGDVVFLADFGVSDTLGDDTTISGTNGTKAFFAPELMATASGVIDNGKAVDVWAMGMTLFTLLFGRLPWPCFDAASYQESVQHEPLELPRCAKGDQRALEPIWVELLEGMLTKDPAARWDLHKVRSAIKDLATAAEERELDGINDLLALPDEVAFAQSVTALTDLTGASRAMLHGTMSDHARSGTPSSSVPSSVQSAPSRTVSDLLDHAGDLGSGPTLQLTTPHQPAQSRPEGSHARPSPTPKSDALQSGSPK
jgi:serine/threonine protein kinase